MGRLPGEQTQVETRLAAWRVHRGLTQEEIATAVGMSLTAYRRIERGIERNPGIQHVVNLCLVLKCNVTELTGLSLKPECWTAFDARAAEPPDPEEFWRKFAPGLPEGLPD